MAASAFAASAAAAASIAGSGSRSSGSRSSGSSGALIEPPQCPVCTLAYECDEPKSNTDSHLPRTLPCTHSLCSACLLQLIKATPGRVKCPTCRDERAIHLSPRMSAVHLSPAEWVRLIPQSADIIQSIRRSRHLEAALQRERLLRLQSVARCACDLSCADAAAVWCAQCDGDLCAKHDAALHRADSLAAHQRIPLAEKAAASQAKMAMALMDARAAATRERLKKAKMHAALASGHGSGFSTSDLSPQPRESSVSRSVISSRFSSSSRSADLLRSLSAERLSDLARFLDGVSLDSARLLYCATRDGFKARDFWRRCAGKAATLTIVKVQRNGFVFGAFTPARWPADPSTKGYIADPSGRTFLFSLINAHGRAVKLRLKPGEHANAISCYGAAHGPTFGGAVDLRLMWCAAADQPLGCLSRPLNGCFEVDQQTEAEAGRPPIPFRYGRSLLAGGERKKHFFAAAEIEVYQLQA